MNNVSILNFKKIHQNITNVENNHKKIDEWFIPRDRESFFLTHDFHPYFAAFPPEIVSKLLKKYTKKGDLILDPFVGGGSTIVESYRLKRKSIGIDISPLSIFITKVKTTPVDIDLFELKMIKKRIRESLIKYKMGNYKNFKYDIPEITNIDNWFNKDTAYDLATILHFIKKIEDKDFHDFLLLAFSSIIRKVSKAKNVQQHLCYKKNKKIPDVYQIFEEKVNLMTNQMKKYIDNLGNLNDHYIPDLYVKDVRRLTEGIDKNSIGSVITSPPYGTGSRYSEIYRLSFQWLELKKPNRKDALENSKNFSLELSKGLKEIYKVLRKNKYCFFVYGDPSTKNGLTKKAIDDAKEIGFSYEGLISCPIKKTSSLHHERYIRYIPKDFILIFKKKA